MCRLQFICCTVYMYLSITSIAALVICPHRRQKIETNVARVAKRLQTQSRSSFVSRRAPLRVLSNSNSILICLLAPVSKRFRFRKHRMRLRRFHLSMPRKWNIGSKREPEIHVAFEEIHSLPEASLVNATHSVL